MCQIFLLIMFIVHRWDDFGELPTVCHQLSKMLTACSCQYLGEGGLTVTAITLDLGRACVLLGDIDSQPSEHLLTE